MSSKYTIHDFLEVKASDRGRFSPDGKQIAYVSNLTGTNQIYLMSADGGKAIQLTNFQDFISSYSFSPTQNTIVFSKAEGGDENTQLFLLDPVTKEVESLTNENDVRHNLDFWSYDGKMISYSSNQRNGRDFDVYVMDVEAKKSKCVYEGKGWFGAVGFSPNSKYLMIREAHSSVNSDIYIHDLQTDSTELLTKHEGDIFHGTPQWLPDESDFFLTSNERGEFVGLTRYSLTEKKFEYVLTPEWDINGVALDKAGKYLAITINEEGYSKTTLYNPNTLEELNLKFPSGQISGINFSEDSTKIIFTLGNSVKTVDVWSMDIASGECKQLTKSPQGVPSKMLVEPELVRFKSFDGLSVPAFVYRPSNTDSDNRLPTIINIHGGPESQYQPNLALLTQYFVHAGYVVVAPNVRGSSGYGKTYLSLDNVEKRLDSVKDIVSLHKYLATLPYIDTDRVALMGGSYGGFMVLAALAFYPKLWAAGVDIVGIVNFVSFLENTASYRQALREAEYGSLEKDKELLKKISPINSIDNIIAPLFVIHGANDPRVPLSEAEQVVSRLKELGRDVELLVYSDEGHGLAKLKNRIDAYPKVSDFLSRVFKLN